MTEQTCTEQNEYELSEQKHLHHLRSSGQNPIQSHSWIDHSVRFRVNKSWFCTRQSPDYLKCDYDQDEGKWHWNFLWTRNCIHLSTGHRLSGALTGTLWLNSILKEPLPNTRILGISIKISSQNSSINMWKIQYLTNHVLHTILKSPL